MAAQLVPLPRPMPAEPEWAGELEEALARGDLPEPAQRFEIDSVGKAEWAMALVARLVKQRQLVREQAEEWRQPVDAWQRREEQRLGPAIEHFSVLLEGYAIERRLEDERQKTLDLPSGQVSTRKPGAPKVVIASEEELLAWLDERPGYAEQWAPAIARSVRLTEARELLEAREVAEPWCIQCGEQLTELVVLEGEPPRWLHLTSSTDEDHDAEAGVRWAACLTDPGAGFFGGGDVAVPGCAVEAGWISAKVKPAQL